MKEVLIIDDIFEIWEKDFQNNIIVCKKFSPFTNQLRKYNHFIFGKNDSNELLKINYTA